MARKKIGSTLMAAMSGSIEEEEALIEASKSASDERAAQMSNPAVERAKLAIINEGRHATQLLPPNQIRMSPISDRLDPGEDLVDLIESIRSEGQQVPIMVRRLADGELEVVYGRRRLLACRALKIDVRAAITELTDEEAIIAQGLENNARKDSSFIEKALFVMRILNAGFKAVVVHKATGVNETTISKMRSILNDVPEDLIMHIGPAHGAGRRQWDLLKSYCQSQSTNRVLALIEDIPKDLPSMDRLNFALEALKTPAPSKSRTAKDRGPRVSTRIRREKMTITADQERYLKFLAYLDAEMPKLLDAWDIENP